VQTTTVTDTNTNTTTNTTTDNNTNITTNSVTNNSTGETVTTTTNNTTGETVTTTSTTEPIEDEEETPSTGPVTEPPTTTPETKTETKKTPKKRQQILLGGLGLGMTPTLDEVSKLTFKDPFISSRVGQERFRGPLEQFFQEVEGMPDNPTIQDMLEQKLLADKEAMPDYFTYGKPTEIEEFFGFEKPRDLDYELPVMTAAQGGLATPLMAYGGLAGGGLPMVAHSGKARVDFRQGAAVTGPGDGQSDDIPAMLADGEFVFPADVVAALGNGSTKAGSKKLYEMMHSIRAHHRSAGPKDLPPPAKKNPLDYLKKSRR